MQSPRCDPRSYKAPKFDADVFFTLDNMYGMHCTLSAIDFCTDHIQHALALALFGCIKELKGLHEYPWQESHFANDEPPRKPKPSGYKGQISMSCPINSMYHHNRHSALLEDCRLYFFPIFSFTCRVATAATRAAPRPLPSSESMRSNLYCGLASSAILASMSAWKRGWNL